MARERLHDGLPAPGRPVASSPMASPRNGSQAPLRARSTPHARGTTGVARRRRLPDTAACGVWAPVPLPVERPKAEQHADPRHDNAPALSPSRSSAWRDSGGAGFLPVTS